MANFNPANAYWFVAGDETKVFSSATGDYVSPTAPAFLAFLESGGAVTRIANEQELGEVLAPYSVRPSHPGILDAYKDAQALKLTVEIVAKVCFNHENRLRALENKAPINANQFKNALKDLM